MTNSKPLDDLIKIEDDLRDNFDDFRFIYLDANKQRGRVSIVKFSDALARFDFNLDRLQNLIDRLSVNREKS